MSEHVAIPEFEGFAANARQGRIAFPKCDACGKFHWYPMPRCPHCRSSRITWTPVAGTARIFSLTEVRHAFDKSRRDALPYIVALITFDGAPGVRLITNIVGTTAANLAIDEMVEPVFDDPEARGAPVVFRKARGARP